MWQCTECRSGIHKRSQVLDNFFAKTSLKVMSFVLAKISLKLKKVKCGHL